MSYVQTIILTLLGIGLSVDVATNIINAKYIPRFYRNLRYKNAYKIYIMINVLVILLIFISAAFFNGCEYSYFSQILLYCILGIYIYLNTLFTNIYIKTKAVKKHDRLMRTDNEYKIAYMEKQALINKRKKEQRQMEISNKRKQNEYNKYIASDDDIYNKYKKGHRNTLINKDFIKHNGLSSI